MKKLCKKIVVNIILALVLLVIFATTASASYYDCFLNTNQTYAETPISGASFAPYKCRGLGYNNVLSQTDIRLKVWGGTATTAADLKKLTPLYNNMISPNIYKYVNMAYGITHCLTRLEKNSTDNSTGKGYAYWNIQY